MADELAGLDPAINGLSANAEGIGNVRDRVKSANVSRGWRFSAHESDPPHWNSIDLRGLWMPMRSPSPGTLARRATHAPRLGQAAGRERSELNRVPVRTFEDAVLGWCSHDFASAEEVAIMDRIRRMFRILSITEVNGDLAVI